MITTVSVLVALASYALFVYFVCSVGYWWMVPVHAVASIVCYLVTVKLRRS